MLVSGEWLESRLEDADLFVLDASWFLPIDGRDARAEFETAHIPGALFFDLDEVSDPDSDLPHMLPSEAHFASRMRALGLGDGDRIIAYDNSPLHSAARAWWMLTSFGARHVALLDGGFDLWRAEGRPIESGPSPAGSGHFTARLDRGRLADKRDVAHIVGEGGPALVDARSAPRFAGEESEPRPGLAAGHMPGARNLPQGRLFAPDGRWKSDEEIVAAFARAGVDPAAPMVTTCGSGVTAAVLQFAAERLGNCNVRLYDGSWSEWGADPAAPKIRGVA